MKSVTTVSLSQVGSRRTWSAREDMRLSRSHGKTPCTLTVRIVFLALMPFQGAKIGDQKSSMQHYLGDGVRITVVRTGIDCLREFAWGVFLLNSNGGV